MASVRPPSLPPTLATPSFSLTRVYLLHPGYGAYDNIILTLPAVDGTQTRPGLHHRTVLTAGAIIADNAFDRAYLTRDQAGKNRIDTTVPLDGLLEPGNYWLQLEGYELFRADADQDARDGASSMAPPPHPSTQAAQAQLPNPDTPIEQNIYPVVPSFGDWQFPHNKLPPEWRQRHPAPSIASPSALHTNPTSHKPSHRCYITGYQIGINDCHLVPKNQNIWWANNGMRRYTKLVTGLLGDEANIALLRADIHQLFDRHGIAIVPKPLLLSPASDQSPAPGSYAFAAHVLKDDDESREFYDLLYHNVAIPQYGVDKLSPEFLFARFAWAIFSSLQTFLESSTRRYLTLTVRNETAPGSCETSLRWMNGQELTSHLATRGVTRSGSRSRKRSSSQMTQNDEDFDMYQERWARRCHDIDSTDTSSDNLDPETRQIREGNSWYEEVGQHSRARDPEEERIKENTRWYEQVGQHSRARDPEEERIRENTRWYEEVGQYSRACDPEEERIRENTELYEEQHTFYSNSTGDQYELDTSDRAGEDGRFRIQEPSQSPDLEGIPPLSRSFTTAGSNRSSVFLDAPVNEDGAEQAVATSSSRDKVMGADDGQRHNRHDLLADRSDRQTLGET